MVPLGMNMFKLITGVGMAVFFLVTLPDFGSGQVPIWWLPHTAT
jgi:hypothetical protein